jgi:hypothetical protein
MKARQIRIVRQATLLWAALVSYRALMPRSERFEHGATSLAGFLPEIMMTLMIFMGALFLTWRAPKLKVRFRSAPVGRWMILLVLSQLLAGVLSGNLAYEFYRLMPMCSALMLLRLIWLHADERTLPGFLTAVFGAPLVYLISYLFFLFTGQGNTTQLTGRFMPEVWGMHPLMLGFISAICGIYWMLLWVRTHSNRALIPAGLCLGLLGYIGAKTATLMYFLVLLVFMMPQIIRFLNNPFRLLLVAAGTAGFALVAFGEGGLIDHLIEYFSSASGGEALPTVDSRTMVWRAVWEKAFDSLPGVVFGHGITHLTRDPAQIFQDRFVFVTNSSHNTLLQVFYEAGIVGVFSVIAVKLTALRYLVFGKLMDLKTMHWRPQAAAVCVILPCSFMDTFYGGVAIVLACLWMSVNTAMDLSVRVWGRDV